MVRTCESCCYKFGCDKKDETCMEYLSLNDFAKTKYMTVEQYMEFRKEWEEVTRELREFFNQQRSVEV